MQNRGVVEAEQEADRRPRWRRRKWRALGVAGTLIAAVVATTAGGSGAPASADAGGTEWWQTPDAKELTIDLNSQRNWYGRPTLPADGVLSYWAEVHASLMNQAGYLYHEDLGALMRITGCRSMAENVGYASTVWNAHAALSNSPQHLSNMLGNWRLTGIGVSSGRGQNWVVQIFCTW